MKCHYISNVGCKYKKDDKCKRKRRCKIGTDIRFINMKVEYKGKKREGMSKTKIVVVDDMYYRKIRDDHQFIKPSLEVSENGLIKEGFEKGTLIFIKDKLFREGLLVQAWDKSPRCGGKKIAIIQIMDIRQEKLIDITDEEEKKEGGLWGSATEFVGTWLDNYAKKIDDYDRLCNELIYRIEFKVLSKEAQGGSKTD